MSAVSHPITMKHLLKAVKKNNANLLMTYLEGMEELKRLDVLSKRQCSTGFTPLCEAVSNGSLEICRILLLFGADVNTKGNYVDGDYTPLQMAVRAGKSAIFQVLLEAGAIIDINFIYNNNASLLQYAIYNNDHETARKLIDLGADLNYCSSRDRYRFISHNRPLEIAIRSDNIDMVQLLMVSGVNLCSYRKDHDYFDAVKQAERNGRSEILEYLTTYQNRYDKATRSFKRAQTEILSWQI
jgi:ankyrin repeat protein